MVELFAGIGGFSCAFEHFDVRTTAMVEIDPSCRSVLAARFPDATLFEDVKEVSGDAIRATGFRPERGILTGGWPCQDISVAGKQAGLAGERSGLFSEVVRLLTELQPQYFVLENVPRLLSINSGRDMGSVVGALVELGYGIAYRVLDAQYFGVPQRRRRVFFVGCAGDTGERAAQILFEPKGVRGDSSSRGQAQSRATGSVGSSVRSSGGAQLTHTHTHISTLQGGGKRGYRVDAEGAAGGHLIVSPH